ncbi:hypothetical protein HYDPIDRAFT_28257 [Hydnomerulius pinastri MD-312]|uniref:DUF6534 domain-containing protein n=1 Tax=Hydnomerulius pinastri MD-312 TaxID=994086 RepID=A0A0C9WG69_9AGAM|nr:hypothetical protein HYDPIDRAFT_28257 [Hydnomerulius pinastri MD-312]
MKQISDLNLIIGPMEIGLVGAAVLFGLVIVQTYMYYKRFPKDSWWIKSMVALEILLQIPNLISITITIWTMTITNYGQPETLVTLPVSSVVPVVLGAPTAFVVQAFFSYRLYKLSKRLILPIFSLSLATIRFVMNMVFGIAGFYMTSVASYEQEWRWMISTLLSVSITCDVTIGAALSCYLYAKRNTGFRQTSLLIDQLIIYAIETGLVTSVTDLVEAICFWTMPNNFIWMGVYAFESGLFVNSLLASLNRRAPLFNGRKDAERVFELDSEFASRNPDSTSEGQRRKSLHPIAITISQDVHVSVQKGGLGGEVLTDIA